MCCRYFHSALFLSPRLPTAKMRRRILRARGDFCEQVSNFIFWISLLPTFLFRHSPYLKPPVCAQICDCKFVLKQRSRGISPKCPALPEISVCWTSCVKKVFLRYWCSSSCAFFSAFWTCAYILNTHTQNAGNMYG